MSKKFIILFLLAIFTLQLIALWPSFKLALFGDDWLAFWRVWINLDPIFPVHYNPIKYFLTPYGPQDINMGILRYFFGFYSPPYYIVSFVWRLAAGYTLFFISLKFFRNKLAALFAGIFFAVSTIGLDTTNWVFNMTSYAGLLFLIIFIYFYFYSRQQRSIKLVPCAFFFLFLATIIVPIRMHGAFILIIFCEMLWLIAERAKQNIQYTFFRLIVFLLTLLLITITGTSLGVSISNPIVGSNETVVRTQSGIRIISTYIQQGHLWVILTPLMSFGNMIFPSDLWNKTDLGQSSFYQLSFIFFIIYIVLIFLLTPKEKRTNIYIYKLGAIGLCFNFIVWLLHKNDALYFSSDQLIGSMLIGGYTLIFLVNLILQGSIDKKYNIFSIMAIFWPFAFILFPWITLNPAIAYDTTYRYMIVSSVGVAYIWALLALLKVNKKILISIFIFHIILQTYASYDYLNMLAERRGREISERIWSTLEKELPKFDTKKIYVILFASDGTNNDIVYNTAFFGFPGRMSIRDNIAVYHAPIAITTYPELVSAVTDGKTLKMSGYAEKPISPKQTITYLITGQTLNNIKVQNITDQVIGDLNKISKEYLNSHPGVTYQN